MKKKYVVYFDQVNQSRYEFITDNEEIALKRAIREWRKENSNPSPSYTVEETNYV